MKYKTLQKELNNIKRDIESNEDSKNLKEFLREKLHQVGKLLFQYTNPLLTEVKSGKTEQIKQQNKGGKNTTTYVFGTNHNCPYTKDKNVDGILGGSNFDNPYGLNITSFSQEDLLRIPDINTKIQKII